MFRSSRFTTSARFYNNTPLRLKKKKKKSTSEELTKLSTLVFETALSSFPGKMSTRLNGSFALTTSCRTGVYLKLSKQQKNNTFYTYDVLEAILSSEETDEVCPVLNRILFRGCHGPTEHPDSGSHAPTARTEGFPSGLLFTLKCRCAIREESFGERRSLEERQKTELKRFTSRE